MKIPEKGQPWRKERIVQLTALGIWEIQSLKGMRKTAALEKGLWHMERGLLGLNSDFCNDSLLRS